MSALGQLATCRPCLIRSSCPEWVASEEDSPMTTLLTDVYLALLISIPLVVAMAGLFCMRKAYSTYKLLGDRFKNMPFLIFYAAFQSPWYARQFWGQADISESIPADLKSSVANSRRQINYGMVVIVLWGLFVLSFGALAAYLRRHT